MLRTDVRLTGATKPNMKFSLTNIITILPEYKLAIQIRFCNTLGNKDIVEKLGW